MAINTYRFWMATDANRLLANQFAFIQAAAPSFYQGNVAQLELHIVASAGVGTSPVEVPFPAGAAISVAVGDTNTYPTGGSWQLMVGTVETEYMPYNATIAQVSAALNALSEVTAAGGVSVSKTGDGYTITWNTYGSKPSIGIGSDTLTPSSYESISLVQAGNAEHRQIVFVELRQNPIALSTTWTALPTPSVTVTEVQAWNGTNRIWRVGIEPQPKAGSITISYGTKTATLAYNASPASIASALSPAQVFATGQYQWDIVISEDSVLSASGSLVGYNGYGGSINFATAECHQFLAGAERKSTVLEVSISIDDKRYTLLQTACNIFADVVSDGVLQPLPLGVAMSEQVANVRFVRRDIDQNPDAPTLNVIWQNLGVETLGSDVAGALDAADSPSASNPFATISDIPNVTQAEWGNIIGTLSDQTDLQAVLDSKADTSDALLKADNLFGLADTTTARNNLGLGSQNQVTFRSVDGSYGNDGFSVAPGSSQVQSTIYGFTDPNIPSDILYSSFTSNSSVLPIDIHHRTWADEQDYYDGIINTQQRLSYDVSDGFGTITLLSKANKFSTVSQLSIKPTGITFPNASVQTIAFPGFENAALSGNPTAPTPSLSDNNTSIATTAFVKGQGYITSAPVTSVAGRTGAVTLSNTDISGLGTMATQSANDYLLKSGGVLTGSLTAPLFYQQGDGDNYISIGNGGFVSRINNNYGYLTSSGFKVIGTDPLYNIELDNGNPGINEHPTVFVRSPNKTATYGTSDITFYDNGDIQPGYIKTSGGTFIGKVNFTSVSGAAGINIGIGGVQTAATTPGDMWITTGGANLNFRDGTGAWKVLASLQNGNVFTAVQTVNVTSTNPALRVTQMGTGNALLVEDVTTPDTSAFVVDSSGNVGIGVASGYTSTSKVEVVGNVKADTFSNGVGPTFSINSTTSHTGGTDTLDLLVTINGVQYRIGLRPA